MSWESFIENKLINCQRDGHVYCNVLSDAIILDLHGKTLATTGVSMNCVDAQNLKEFFEQVINTILYLKLGNKKYRILHFEQNKLAYIRDGEVGGRLVRQPHRHQGPDDAAQERRGAECGGRRACGTLPRQGRDQGRGH